MKRRRSGRKKKVRNRYKKTRNNLRSYKKSFTRHYGRNKSCDRHEKIHKSIPDLKQTKKIKNRYKKQGIT